MGPGLLLGPWSLAEACLLVTHPPPRTGPESTKGIVPPGEGAGGTRLTHPAPCHSPISRWSGRMQS